MTRPFEVKFRSALAGVRRRNLNSALIAASVDLIGLRAVSSKAARIAAQKGTRMRPAQHAEP